MSAVSAGPESGPARTGLVIRFFTPQGRLITEVRPGDTAYDDAFRLAMD